MGMRLLGFGWPARAGGAAACPNPMNAMRYASWPGHGAGHPSALVFRRIFRLRNQINYHTFAVPKTTG